jgi:glycosyltransferase involved in cell wall biosynthesis
MRVCYVLLSPTFGMHQYTADLANRLACRGYDVHLVTTALVPRDRYAPAVTLHTPVDTADSGFSPRAMRPSAVFQTLRTIRDLGPDVVHFTGPHLWNLFLVRALTARGIPVVHTIHDLHPHVGASYGRLLYVWNRGVRHFADHLLVHGRRYRDELLEAGLAASAVTYTPLTHLFVGHDQEQALAQTPPAIRYEPWALFFARLEVYKGLAVLLQAAQHLQPAGGHPIRLVVAGRGDLGNLIQGPVPANVEVHNRLIDDKEAIDLFSRCGLVVLPYIEASQSALVAAAYAFHKPVIVTEVGALPEYVIHGETGWVIPPQDPQALSSALQAALQDPAGLARMGDAGLAWYDRQRQAEGIVLQEMYARLGHGKVHAGERCLPGSSAAGPPDEAEA